MASFHRYPGSATAVSKTLKGPSLLRRRSIILEKVPPVKGTFSVAKGEPK